MDHKEYAAGNKPQNEPNPDKSAEKSEIDKHHDSHVGFKEFDPPSRSLPLPVPCQGPRPWSKGRSGPIRSKRTPGRSSDANYAFKN